MTDIIEKLGITPGLWEMILKSNKEWATRSKQGILFTFWKPTRYPDQFDRYEKETKESFNNAKLVTAAPEMLEAFIEQYLSLEKIFIARELELEDYSQTVSDELQIMQQFTENIIEKACYPKTWNEIKELFNE